MKILKCALLIILQVYGLRLQAGCHQEVFTITEILNHDSQARHVFTCEILATYQRNSAYESVAVIKYKYRGEPQDTVYIKTGGQTTAGGSKMRPRERWLIFSITRDNLHYSATVCEHLSQRIEVPDDEQNSWMISPLGKMYLEVLDIYAEIRADKFTGRKAIIANGRLIAEGGFVEGRPDGRWTHYSSRYYYEHKIEKSEINYKNGVFDGKYLIYNQDKDQNVVIEKLTYGAGRIKQVKTGRQRWVDHVWTNDWTRDATYYITDSTGEITNQGTTVYLSGEHPEYREIRYKHGYSLNRKKFYPNEDRLLGEGDYFHGRKVGTWYMFNDLGEPIDSLFHPEVSSDDGLFQIWDEAGSLITIGKVDSTGTRTGIWKNYYDHILSNEIAYAADGRKIYEIRYYGSGGNEYTPYVNGKKHGTRIRYSLDGKIRSLGTFADGQLNGRSIFFNEDGSIAREENYRNGRRTTVYNSIGSNYYKNGYRRGPFVQYDHATGRKTSEGNYWMGYRIGAWIQYNADGSYQKQYYPTDKDYLMKNLYDGPTAWEDYDKDGKLVNRNEREGW